MQSEYADFKSAEELKIWLKNFVSLADWSRGGAKSVEQLFDEIRNGDCSIQTEPPLRIVRVVQVLVQRDNLFLLEKEQLLADNRTRLRNLPPSEKMKPGEECQAAAVRCLEEELGINEDQVEMIGLSSGPKIIVRSSTSYPGLNSKYFIFPVVVKVNHLPEQDFWTDEQSSGGDHEVIHRHRWGWGEIDPETTPL
mgnify:CR=1 FL=1|jgi:hypothetical protein